jgi:hypothetical protein
MVSPVTTTTSPAPGSSVSNSDGSLGPQGWALAKLLEISGVHIASKNNVPGGGPALEPPSFDPTTLLLLSTIFDTQQSDQEAKTAEGFIDYTTNEKIAAQKSLNDAVAKQQDAAQKAAAASSDSQIADWVMSVAALVGAVAIVVGTVGTGAAAAAVLVGVAATGIAALQVANMAVKTAGVQVTDAMGETKPLSLDFGGLVDAVVAQQMADGNIVETHVDADGKTVDQSNNVIDDAYRKAHPGATYMDAAGLAQWKSGWTEALNVALGVAMVAAGAGGASAAMTAAKTAEKVGEDAAKLSKMVQWSANGVQGVSDATQGGAAIYGGKRSQDVAYADFDKNRFIAQQHLYESTLTLLSRQMTYQMNGLNQALTTLNDRTAKTSDAIANVASASRDLARIYS